MTGAKAEMRERDDEDLVIKLRDSLALSNYAQQDMLKDLQEYRKLLAAVFDNDRHREYMTFSKFLTTPYGQDWERDGSLLLVLLGRNESGLNTDHSWLSPVAVDLIQNLLGSSEPVAYDCCAKSRTLEEVMSRLICQLLQANPAVIRRPKDFQYIESQLTLKGDGSSRIVALRAALSRIIDRYERPVFIVLDRPELCGGSKAITVETLLSLLKDVKVELKIMMIQRGEFWDIEQRRNEIDIQGVDPNMLRIARMDQYRL